MSEHSPRTSRPQGLHMWEPLVQPQPDRGRKGERIERLCCHGAHSVEMNSGRLSRCTYNGYLTARHWMNMREGVAWMQLSTSGGARGSCHYLSTSRSCIVETLFRWGNRRSHPMTPSAAIYYSDDGRGDGGIGTTGNQYRFMQIRPVATSALWAK